LPEGSAIRSSPKKNAPESVVQNSSAITSGSLDHAQASARSCECSTSPSGPGCCRDNLGTQTERPLQPTVISAETNPAQLERRSGTGRPPQGSVVDRRLGIDRRNKPGADKGASTSSDTGTGTSSGTGSGTGTGLERRRSAGRRLSDFTKSAEEGELTKEQFLFLMAVDAFKKANDRMYPTWTDVLEVVRLLGYRKTMPSELRIGAAEDWLEISDTPANVRPQRWGERAA